MEILTSAEMSAVDRDTTQHFDVPLAALMDTAGTAVARFCRRHWPAARSVAVLCGKGNNGGDGLVAARVLAVAGVGVAVLLLGREDELKGEAATALTRLRAEAPSVAIWPVLDEASLAAASDTLTSAELLVDAIVGTGFKPPLRGIAVSLRTIVAQNKTPVLAVDLPSGWDADSTKQTFDGAFPADAVVTFTRPKPAHVFGHLTRATFGPVVVAEIGSPAEAIQSTGRLSWAGAAKTIAERPRDGNSNKGMYGHVLIVGGSDGKAGAPSMASLAALRTGAGLVTAAVPRSILPTVASSAPELMLAPLDECAKIGTEEAGLSLEQLEEAPLASLLRGKTVVGIGPGLGQARSTKEFVHGFVQRVSLPMVLDADALNAFAGCTQLLQRAVIGNDVKGKPRTLVLTPHPGEMARLTGLTVAQVEADRIGLARGFATEHKLTLVLKGWRTLVAHPDGRVAVNTSGNPAMAKGGSGDILTGIIAAMLAQYARSGDAEDVARTVEAAVCLHGLAADFAARAMDEHTVLATDTLAHLSDAFRYRARDVDGMTWICGLNRTKA